MQYRLDDTVRALPSVDSLDPGPSDPPGVDSSAADSPPSKASRRVNFKDKSANDYFIFTNDYSKDVAQVKTYQEYEAFNEFQREMVARLLLTRAQERGVEDKPADWRLNYTHPSANVAVSSFGPEKPLPEVTLPTVNVAPAPEVKGEVVPVARPLELPAR